jgi:PAS domain-containing protein/two-component sensor histidine kinase
MPKKRTNMSKHTASRSASGTRRGGDDAEGESKMRMSNTDTADNLVSRSMHTDNVYDASRIETREDVEFHIGKYDRAKLEAVLENAYIGEWEYNAESWLVYLSPCCDRILVYDTPQGPWGPARLMKCIYEDDREMVREAFRAALGSDGYMDVECRIVAVGGVVRWVRIQGIMARGEKEVNPSIVGVVRDITKRKLSDLKKDEFISMASHELKTPLTSLKIHSQFLERKLVEQNDEDLLAHVKKMDRQLNKLSALVDDMLRVTSLDLTGLEMRREPFSLLGLTDEVVEGVQGMTYRHVVTISAEEDVRVNGDRDRVGQVLVNLLSNAVKYSPIGSSIQIDMCKEGDQALVRVRDFGIGVPSADRERIFERFFRSEGAEEKTFPGLGIGLYICRQIVEEHGGEVPDSMAELVSLPGVARKTANIVLWNSYPEQAGRDPDAGIAVDTHVKRLSQRLRFSAEKDPDKIERDLMAAIPKRDWYRSTYLFIEHGRAVCKAPTPRCEDCAVNHLCPSSRV